jgi:hypothetical protein
VINGELFATIKGDNVLVVVVEDVLKRFRIKKRHVTIEYSI